MTRRPLDHYPTPTRLTMGLLQYVPIVGRVLEPCAGEGLMAETLQTFGLPLRTVLHNDINPQYGYTWTEDATNPDAAMWREARPGWVVTNPPFNQAMPILENAYRAARIGVAFLLRLSFLEPTHGRRTWLQAHATEMSNLIIFGSPRPSFTDDGRTDSATVAWMVWQHGWTGGQAGGTDVQFVTGWDGRR